ncbi:MAG: hypothetical protein K9N47_08480 [Prosthecobacter sp.]|uniref:hypothetical protein n=1 Tax=Prosthecobacter sp. TaxID=1965333 RepID=UPI0025CCF2C3|nr:hypothetical protein [Prosthecobacter sp.]MCF7786145.1 hypothetical protein [Prosthecobacter sp.]
MNREEARLELDATTLRPQDASPEARAMAESDPELGAWLKQRTAFDEQVAGAFAASIPAGLRESILQNARKPAKRSIRWVLPVLAAAAAVVVGWTMLWPVSNGMPGWQADSLAAVTKVEYGMSKVDHMSRDFEAIKKMLVAHQSPTPNRLPGTVGTMPVLACKRIQIAGRAASIICFEIQPGKEAHLVVMDNTGLTDLPPQLQPQFKASKNWNMASWSDGSQTFLLATTADEAALKKLFGIV